MATTDVGKGVSKFVSDLMKDIDTKAKDKISEVAAKLGADLIRQRTRSGLGIATDYGSTYRLKPLSAKYIDYRSRARDLSPYTTPSKSNLTFTGQMLDSLGARRSQSGSWRIILKGSHSKARISNAQLAKYVSKNRPFMFLSGGEIEEIRKTARKTFQDLVKNNFSR